VRNERVATRGGWPAVGTVLVVLLVVQVAGLAHVPFLGVRPDLLLVFAIGVALQRGALEGLLMGLVAGLLVDAVAGHLVGLSAVAYGVTGLALGYIGERIYPDRALVVLAGVAGGTLLSQLVYLAGASAFGLPWPRWEGLVQVILALAGYHLMLSPVVYPISRWASGVLSARGDDARLEA